MPSFDLEGLRADVRDRIGPFLEEVVSGYVENVHSVHITGSSLTGDFDPKSSDVNSIFVLREMDLKFLEVLAPMGVKYGKKSVAAPLIMTPAYVSDSVDVFPLEFLSFKLIHKTVLGDDIFSGLEIHKPDLRAQCEREIKAKLVWIRQGYISAAGDTRVLCESFVRSITGYVPLFRGIILLKGMSPPAVSSEVLDALGKATGVDCGVFSRLLRQKKVKEKLEIGELNSIFEQYYDATDRLRKVVDEIAL